MTLKAYDTLTGAEVRPGDTIRSRAAGLEYTFREAIRATTATRDGSIEVDYLPGRVRYHAGMFGLRVSAANDDYRAELIPDFIPPSVTALKAYREDGTEVRPGDLIDMAGADYSFTFLAATVASGSDGLDGMIAVEGYPDMFASPFGLTVRAVPAVADEPEWHSACTGEPGEIRRDIRGPGGFYALAGPYEDSDQWGWNIIDSSDGETLASASGNASSPEAAKAAVTAWEREHGLIPGGRIPLLPDVTPPPAVHDAGPAGHECENSSDFAALVNSLSPASSDRPEPAEPVRDLRAILADLEDNRAELIRTHESGADDDSSERDAYLGALENLADAVRAQLAADSDAGELAAEADRTARTTAPPVPGVTQNTGHTVYAVLGHQPAIPGVLESWIVAAADDQGEHVTWDACASNDGSGTLHYSEGHYHTPGEGTGDEALVDLAHRAGIFRRLTNLSSGVASRQAFQDSHASVMTELAEVHGVGRARVRSGLLEAAALGYARISWTTDGTRKDYGIRYDRYRCIFSWNREY